MPSAEASFRNLILNQRVDTTVHFIDLAEWKACAGVPNEKSDGRPAYAALDLGATRDLTALVTAFSHEDGSLDVAPFFWLAGDLQQHEDTDQAPYRLWQKQGHILAGGEKTLDPAIVAHKIAELHGQYHFRALAYDRWRIEDLRRQLDAIGCDVELVPFGQGFQDMSPAVDELERLVFEGKLRHGGHPVLQWCVANAVTETDAAGNRKFTKARTGQRIDGCVALAMAVSMAKKAPEARRSVYEERGLLVL
jgi:phage terminase large subunit-like protein